MSWRFVLIFVVATRAWSCMCAGDWPSVKQAWQKAPFVFLGTVESASPDGDGNRTMFKDQSVRIRVDEAFKGVSSGQIIELHQGATDCDAKFKTGERAVYYLFRETNGSWIVPACTHAIGNAEPGGDDLLFLRGLPKSAIGTRLSGEVELYEDSPKQSFHRIGGVPNVRVKISGPLGVNQEATTNSAGVYEVFGLRPGRYSVSIHAPSGFKINFPVVTGSPRVKGDDAAVELALNGGASVGFVLKADTRLSGRMLDAAGGPLADVCIDLEPVEGRGENGARFFDCSKARGLFEMTMMPPGKYWLVARDTIVAGRFSSKSTLYYPGVRDRQRAVAVTINPGKYIEGLAIRIPAHDKRYRMAGKVQYADGATPETATVTFTSPLHGYTETAETGPDGSFGMSVVAGMQGHLDGKVSIMEPMLSRCPELKVGPSQRGIFRFIDANPIPLSSDSDHEDLKLELPSQSCKSPPPGRK